jgi:hypothetical protein
MRWALFLISVLAVADTLTLKDGRVISGTFMGGTSTAIRFVVGDRVETIPIANIERIAFDGAASSPPASSAGLRSGSPSAAPETPDVAHKQQHFCKVIESFRAENMRIVNEPNPVTRAQMKKPDPYDWEDRITALMGTSGRFDNWRGTVRFHVEGQWVILSFFPDCKNFAQAIEFSTASHYRPGTQDDRMLIPLNSPVARGLTGINGNAPVIASGHLFYLSDQGRSLAHGSDSRQRYRGAIDNPRASAAFPHYLAEFDQVALAH